MSKIAERLAIMCRERTPFVTKFTNFVDNMVKNHKFHAGECIVQKLGEGAARNFGIDEKMVKVYDGEKHGRRIAEFKHTFSRPMPAPEKGKKKDADVKITTIYRIEKQSGIIFVSLAKIGEDGKQFDPDVPLLELQRPQVDGSGDGGSYSGGN